MELKQYSHMYFIGIGGIGMSALALYFHAAGKKVAGYDRSETDITRSLCEKGMAISYDEAVESIPETFRSKDRTLVVYTPAIPSGHEGLNFFKSEGFLLYKRAVVLGFITKNSFCMAVAGTHGKTTTTSIIAHLLMESQVSFSAFLGGISENYHSNFISNGSAVAVVEADEFDRSFLNLSPDLACITSMDADHLDIYGTNDAIQDSFLAFSKRLKPDGQLFVKNGLPLKGSTYGLEDDADYSAQNIKIQEGTYCFDFKTPTTQYNDFKFNLPGRHNLSNAIIALAMTAAYGIPLPQLASALASYKGVKRRFTTHIKTQELVFIDDYAHHPTEITAVYEALREMYPQERIMAVFQPHLFSRTRDFAQEFAAALSRFDEVILLDIYPARELPIEGVTSAWLLGLIPHNRKVLCTKAELTEKILNSASKVVVTMGAGDIGEEVSHIKEVLTRGV